MPRFKHFRFEFILLCILPFASRTQNQFANFRLEYNSNGYLVPNILLDSLTMISYGSIQVRSLPSNKMELYKIIKDSTSSTFSFKLSPANNLWINAGYIEDNSLELFGFKFRNDSCWSVHRASNTFISKYTFSDLFEMVLCKDKVSYYKNAILQSTAIDSLRNNATVAVAPQTQVSTKAYIAYQYGNNCSTSPPPPPPPPLDSVSNYFELTTKPNNSYALLSQDKKVSIYYKEKYSITQGVNDIVTIKIWNKNRRVLIKSVNLPNYYGSNFKHIDISNLIMKGELYILEATGINKNDKYYLKFLVK